MEVQIVSPKRGLPGFANETSAYRLPKGLLPGTRLEVLERLGMEARVCDENGREWTLLLWTVDCGHLYKIDGEWRPPHDPLVRASLLDTINNPPEKVPSGLESVYIDLRENAQQVLERWG